MTIFVHRTVHRDAFKYVVRFANIEVRLGQIRQNNSQFDIQQLLFSSPGRKITFWTTFGRGFFSSHCRPAAPLGRIPKKIP